MTWFYWLYHHIANRSTTRIFRTRSQKRQNFKNIFFLFLSLTSIRGLFVFSLPNILFVLLGILNCNFQNSKLPANIEYFHKIPFSRHEIIIPWTKMLSSSNTLISHHQPSQYIVTITSITVLLKA